jgi:replication initiation and membrane attachment protein
MNKYFWVNTHGLISSEDTKVLTLLYQPLIGSHAYGLYMMLINLVDRNTFQSDVLERKVLFDLLVLDEETFSSAIDKLEAIGLLTTFLKDDLYLYRINMPLNARRFLLDAVLGSFLKSEVGEANFDLLFSYFSQVEISRKGYTNITKSFDDVYKSKDLDILKSDLFVMGRKNGSGIIIKDSFDFEKLYEKLPIRIKKRGIYTNRIKAQIASVMYVYNFTIAEMVSILSKSYDEENKSLFYERIALNSQSYFNETYGSDLIHIEKKEEPKHQINLSKLTPQQIIKIFGPTMANPGFALETMRQFIEKNAVDIGLMNGVIIAAIKFNDNFPHINYLEKVLADWLSRGIKTGDDALLILEGIDNSSKTRKKKHRESSGEPDWIDEIMESIGEKWNVK